MRNYTAFICTVILFCVFPHAYISAQPHISFDKTIYDMEYVGYRQSAKVTFAIKNIGNAPLYIYSVSPACACTVVSLQDSIVSAGGETSLTVQYNADMMGTFYKLIAIKTNADGTPIQYLALKGKVVKEALPSIETLPIRIGDFMLETRDFDFGYVSQTQRTALRFDIVNVGKTAQSIDLLHLPSYLTLLLADEAEEQPQLLQPLKKYSATLILDPTKVPDFGILQGTFNLSRFAGDKVTTDNELKFEAIVLPKSKSTAARPAIALSEEAIRLGTLNPRGSQQYTVIITNNGKDPLHIERIQTNNSAVNLRLQSKTVRPGKSIRLTVKIDCRKFASTDRQARILLFTNDILMPLSIIQVSVN